MLASASPVPDSVKDAKGPAADAPYQWVLRRIFLARFLDSDEVIERRLDRTVAEIFRAEGEQAFRRLESDALASALATRTPAVIAAAGGVVLSPHNRALLKTAGRVVWLRADPRTLASRVRPNDHRPLLADDPLGVLRRLADDRQDLYAEVADTVIDVDRRDKRDLVREVEALVP
jgi:shikimate dehydrogenase